MFFSFPTFNLHSNQIFVKMTPLKVAEIVQDKTSINEKWNWLLIHRLMSRTGNPLDSKVLMDTQDSLTNSVVFFFIQEQEKKALLAKVHF